VLQALRDSSSILDFSGLTRRNLIGYILNVILSFAHKGLERFYHSGATSGIQAMHAKRLRLILTLLDAAVMIKDMDAPGLRLHRLKGEKKDILGCNSTGQLVRDVQV
jgi:proteic killer suppression protein